MGNAMTEGRQPHLHARSRELLGQAILAARLAQGMSQRELGRRAWLHQTTISRVERGRDIALRLSSLMRILEALGVRHIALTIVPTDPIASVMAIQRDDEV
jgi:transcriptional regulator with XRE-family HTH domain